MWDGEHRKRVYKAWKDAAAEEDAAPGVDADADDD